MLYIHVLSFDSGCKEGSSPRADNTEQRTIH